jgi:hypothetical protein
VAQAVRTAAAASIALSFTFDRITSLAISGEAHRDDQGYHDGRSFVMCTGSELSVAGFVRFIAWLAGVPW